MNKKATFFFRFATLLVVVVAVANVNVIKNSQNHLSNLAFINVQALASNEDGEGDICYKKMQGFQGMPMQDKTWCDTCKPKPMYKWENKSNCK